jgi:1-acyl-sn-glycerol-3-phosphate acyltransferase
MSKVLGDNPFGEGEDPPEQEGAPEPPRPPEEEPRPARKRARKAAAASAGETLPASPPPPPLADDAAPDSIPPDEAWGDVFYGEEAAPPPPGDYGPSLDRRKEIPYTRQSITDEVRELERRVRARLTPAFPIEHRRPLPLEPFWRRYRELAMRDRSDTVDELGRDPLYAARAMPLLELLYDRYFRVTTTGGEHIPETGRAILVANHSGTLPYDGGMLMVAVKRASPSRRDLRPLVEDFVFHFPFLGTFVNRLGGVRACQENAERLLARDQLIAVFPEGEKGLGKLYRERYRLQRFGRGGFIKLALRTGAPIIPTAIVGAEEIHPMVGKITLLARSLGVPYLPITPTFPFLGPLGLLPLPTKWTIRFGEPIDVAAQVGPSAADDRLVVNKLAETVRSSIQEMVDEALSQRKSILFG